MMFLGVEMLIFWRFWDRINEYGKSFHSLCHLEDGSPLSAVAIENLMPSLERNRKGLKRKLVISTVHIHPIYP